MSNSHVSVNAVEEKLFVSKAFFKKACKYGTPEYKELHKIMADNPTFKVDFKEYADKRSYHNLTFKRMEAFIKTQPNSEQRLKEFAKVMEVAKARGSMYPSTKKWFLATYPNYIEFEVGVASTTDEANASDIDVRLAS